MWQKPTKDWKPTAGDYVRALIYGAEEFMLVGDAEHLSYDERNGGSWRMADWGCGCCSDDMGRVTHVWPTGRIADLLAAMRADFNEEVSG